MMGLDNPIHLAFILILLLLVFGAKRLPEMGRSLGAGLRGFKESISGDERPSMIAEHTPTNTMAHDAPGTKQTDRQESSGRTPASTSV
ncbi:MAG TPA: twin-arginine translocase TatA/TatE family subunit [Solirubrobacteraceae bacterium]|nr:twin-arginine translocase TatA/TatE family subunit [Solirubrobacteraceae bacterium]